MVKIKKSDISHPSPLYVPSSLGHPASSGSLQSLITPGASSSSSSLCPSPDLTAHQQYYQNPLDASASTTSLVRHELQAQTRPVLTTHKFQSLVQGVQGLQRQLSALAQASQAFVRELDDVLVCIDPSEFDLNVCEISVIFLRCVMCKRLD